VGIASLRHRRSVTALHRGDRVYRQDRPHVPADSGDLDAGAVAVAGRRGFSFPLPYFAVSCPLPYFAVSCGGSASRPERLRCWRTHRPSSPSTACFVNCSSPPPTANCRRAKRDASGRCSAIGCTAPPLNPSPCRRRATPHLAGACQLVESDLCHSRTLSWLGRADQHQRPNTHQALPHRVRHDLPAMAHQRPHLPRQDRPGTRSECHRDRPAMRMGHHQRVHRHLRPRHGTNSRPLPISRSLDPAGLSTRSRNHA